MSAPLIVSWAVTALWLLLPLSPDTSPDDRTPTAPSNAPASYVQMMKFLDADHDNQVDAQELAGGQQSAALILLLTWNECDRDGSDGISRDEFERAAAAATQALADQQSEANTAAEQQAEADLAAAVPIKLILERLAADARYADEVAALRRAVKDLDDDEAVFTYINTHPGLYPHLTPAVQTWVRYYPVRPALRHYTKPAPPGHRLIPPKAGAPAHKAAQPPPHANPVKPGNRPPAHNPGPPPRRR